MLTKPETALELELYFETMHIFLSDVNQKKRIKTSFSNISKLVKQYREEKPFLKEA